MDSAPDSNWQRSAQSLCARAWLLSDLAVDEQVDALGPTTSLDAGRDDGAQPLKPSSQLVSAIHDFERATRLYATALGPHHPRVARALQGAAVAHARAGRSPSLYHGLLLQVQRIRERQGVAAGHDDDWSHQHAARALDKHATALTPAHTPWRRRHTNDEAAEPSAGETSAFLAVEIGGSPAQPQTGSPGRRARQSSRDCASSPGHAFCVDVCCGQVGERVDDQPKPRLKMHTPSSGTCGRHARRRWPSRRRAGGRAR